MRTQVPLVFLGKLSPRLRHTLTHPPTQLERCETYYFTFMQFHPFFFARKTTPPPLLALLLDVCVMSLPACRRPIVMIIINALCNMDRFHKFRLLPRRRRPCRSGRSWGHSEKKGNLHAIQCKSFSLLELWKNGNTIK